VEGYSLDIAADIFTPVTSQFELALTCAKFHNTDDPFPFNRRFDRHTLFQAERTEMAENPRNELVLTFFEVFNSLLLLLMALTTLSL
jgi:hypothetical protein